MTILSDVAASSLEQALVAENGRHATLIVNDNNLRQTVIALAKGTNLPEHNSPPAASIQVLIGAVRVTGPEPVELGEGQIAALTHHRHGVEPLENTAFLLTTVTSVPGEDSYSH